MGIGHSAKSENKGGKPKETDSKLIGPRQEYRRTGHAPDAADSGGGQTTPQPYKRGGRVTGEAKAIKSTTPAMPKAKGSRSTPFTY